MAYNEHFNYTNCTMSTEYTNYSDICVTAHSDYADCTTSHNNAIDDCSTSHTNYDNSHDNHTNSFGSNTSHTSHGNYNDAHSNYNNLCVTAHSDYSNCTTSHNNYANDCSVHSNYVNHVNYANPNTGTPINLTWNSSWFDSTEETTIHESVNAIKELRDKIKFLSENKGQQDVPYIGSHVEDGEFDGVGTDYVEDEQYDTLKANLDALFVEINGTPTGLPDIAEDQPIQKEVFENLKPKIDEIASEDISSRYANHIDYQDVGHTNHNNTVE